jgi:hypothetical protein
MTPVLTRPRPAPPRSRADILTVIVATVAGLALLLVVSSALRLPPFVDAITISNPHEWHVEVKVDGADRSSWIGLGGVGRARTHTYRSVIDSGKEWVFRFSYGGIDGGELVRSRAELEGGGWKVTVPAEFAHRMRAAGVSPSVPE